MVDSARNWRCLRRPGNARRSWGCWRRWPAGSRRTRRPLCTACAARDRRRRRRGRTRGLRRSAAPGRRCRASRTTCEALQAFGNRRGGVGRRGDALLLLLLGWCGAETLGHVGHDGEAHGDVEPVEQVLGVGVEVQRQVAYVVAAVGEEGDGLVGLHALGDEQVEQAPFGFGVVGARRLLLITLIT